MGRPAVLLLPRPVLPLSDHGVSTGGWSYDDVDKIRHVLRRRDAVLYRWMCFGHWSCTQARIHPPVSTRIHFPFNSSSHRHSDIKPDNILMCGSLALFQILVSDFTFVWFRDKDGHVKLSDFGLSTGFQKKHDSNYYQRLLDPSASQSPTATAQAARNSVMVNSINLTMTNKDQIATWKANRRKLVCYV